VSGKFDRIAIRDPLTVIGLGLRINHAAQAQGGEKIAAVWRAFTEGRVRERIANQVHATAIYLAYHDYEKKDEGDCSILLGAAVRDRTPAPPGLEVVVIPAARFAVFEVATQAEVPGAWQRIWSAGLRRTYTGDFEVYRLNQPIEICVAVT
jgi:predicted transcriptional regulator YdeE